MIAANHFRSKRKAFTLIELLIVVAIIAILATIAIPNVLEALVRARVSRVKADMRTIATALDAYFSDHNSYPRDHDNAGWEGKYRWTVWDGRRGPNQVGLYYVTTPVAYITSMAADSF